jgi:Flp pilus assembly protein TadD
MDSSIFKIFKYKPSLITVLLFCLLLVGACDFKEHSKLSQILEAGNKAFAAKQFDEAIRQYDRGLAIRPTEAVFLMNKSSALLKRGIDR